MTSVSEIMVKQEDLAVVDSKKRVVEASELMAAKDCGCLLVMSEGKVVGIVTERDIVRKIVADRVDPSKVLIQDIMTTPVVTTAPESSVEDTARLMVKYHVRRLPIVQGTKLMGLVTSTDIARYLAKQHEYKDELLNAITRQTPLGADSPYH